MMIPRPLFLYDDTVAGPVRMQMPAAELRRRGVEAIDRPYQGTQITSLQQYTAVVFQRPTQDLRAAYQVCRSSGVRIVVDLDDDFLAIPKEHPGYGLIGKGNPQAIQSLQWALAGCDQLVVSTPEMAKRFSPYTARTLVVANRWDDHNLLWGCRRADDGRVNVGWVGSMTHREDFQLVLPALLRLAKERPNVRIVIGADPDIYRTLARVPEKQKLFLPGVKFDTYPWIVAHFDVLLAPLLDTHFNRAKSDIKLLDAGALSIPYVASDVLPYSDSEQEGGVLVKQGADWFGPIAELVDCPDRRAVLGAKGWRAVDRRRISRMTEWAVIAC